MTEPADRQRDLVTPQPDKTQIDEKDDGLALPLLFGNFAAELSVATSICVNVEEIIADRLIEGAPDPDFVRVELQNVDRLVQMLTDFRTLVLHLGTTVEGNEISRSACRKVLVMEDLRRRLLAAEPTRTDVASVQASDVTLF